jgi:hypothetical protein
MGVMPFSWLLTIPGIGGFSILIGAIDWHRERRLRPQGRSITPGNELLPEATREQQCIAKQRSAKLRQLLRFYIFSRDNISPELLAGNALPPLDFLNGELAKSEENWRVQSVSGNNVTTSEI